MRLITKHIILIVIGSLTLWSCASSGPLGGGPEDKEPPTLIKAESSLNMSTNFKKQDIVLVFDEYVEVKDLVKELAVSPPLTYRLQAKVRGKKVTLMFNESEELIDSVTYIINMGNSIRDYRAGNKLENFRYVFSTGDFIDSLSVSGKVIDIATGKPADKAIVMIYDELKDSVVMQKRPFYFTKTDKNGIFTIENMKSDTFRIYASSDQNSNYVFNIGEESIGFLQEDFILDTANFDNIKLELSTPKPKLRVLKYINDYKNTLDIIFNIPLEKKPDFHFDEKVENWSIITKDTLRIWYQSSFDSLKVTLPQLDTFTLFARDKTPKEALALKAPKAANNYRMGDTLYYTFNAPIASINVKDSTWMEKTSFKETVVDSTTIIDTLIEKTPLAYHITKTGYEVGLVPDAEPNTRYIVRVMPGEFTDIYGRLNDTLVHNLNVAMEENLSEVILKLYGFDTLYTSVVKVFTDSKVYYNEALLGRDTVFLNLKRFLPEALKIEVLIDVNNNGIWDGANIWGRIPAEKMFIQEIPIPKPNWTIEEEIDVSKSPVSKEKDEKTKINKEDKLPKKIDR